MDYIDEGFPRTLSGGLSSSVLMLGDEDDELIQRVHVRLFFSSYEGSLAREYRAMRFLGIKLKTARSGC